MRSPFLAAIAPTVALAGGFARWLMQGSGNLYTATSRRAYVPDPDLGWRVVEGGPPWLGLEVLGIIGGLLIATVVGAFVVGRLERSGGRRALLRGVLHTVALAPLAIPVWAFAGGFGPEGARDRLPMGTASEAPRGSVTGGLEAPAGRWDVIENPGSAITAAVDAGGESFDARFAGHVTGSWTADPAHPEGPMSAEVSVDAASVDTGVPMRSESAREEFLKVDEHPRLTFRLDRLLGAEPRHDRLSFRAAGVIGLVGVEQDVEVTGELRILDDAARARLGIEAKHAMLVDADLVLRISASGLAFAASDFDGDEIPVHVSLVLVHREGTSR